MTAMADCFLREVKRMHQLRADINEKTPAEADELIRGLGDDAAEDWIFAARDAQLPPPDLSWCWLFLGGPRRRQIALDVGGGAYRSARWHKAHSLHRPNHDRLSRRQRRRQERYIRDLRP
jgi:hypothetical protein